MCCHHLVVDTRMPSKSHTGPPPGQQRVIQPNISRVDNEKPGRRGQRVMILKTSLGLGAPTSTSHRRDQAGWTDCVSVTVGFSPWRGRGGRCIGVCVHSCVRVCVCVYACGIFVCVCVCMREYMCIYEWLCCK